MSIHTVEEFWDWHIYNFCPALIFSETLPNGEDMRTPPYETMTIQQHNRLTSGFRMMQVFYTRKNYIKSLDVMYMHKTAA